MSQLGRVRLIKVKAAAVSLYPYIPSEYLIPTILFFSSKGVEKTRNKVFYDNCTWNFPSNKKKEPPTLILERNPIDWIKESFLPISKVPPYAIQISFSFSPYKEISSEDVKIRFISVLGVCVDFKMQFYIAAGMHEAVQVCRIYLIAGFEYKTI